MVTMKDLLECGVHFGHQTRKWNPKMKRFIYGVRKNIYIIDLQKSLRYFRYTYNLVQESASKGETMIFVGTKKQAQDAIKTAAENCGMPYVNNRWLGGMLTNHDTIKKGLRKLEIIKKMKEEGQMDLLTKKEALMLSRKEIKLEAYLGGIKDMKKMPTSMFVIDPVKEKIAILEARRLGIKVYAPIDTNCDPDMVDFPIPGNDDAIRSIELFCNEISNAINEGKAQYVEEYEEKADQRPKPRKRREPTKDKTAENIDSDTKISDTEQPKVDKILNNDTAEHSTDETVADKETAEEKAPKTTQETQEPVEKVKPKTKPKAKKEEVKTEPKTEAPKPKAKPAAKKDEVKTVAKPKATDADKDDTKTELEPKAEATTDTQEDK